MNLKHNGSYDAEYSVWISMRQRCNNPKCHAYQWYGARGITICERWSNYKNFIADMGPRPPNTEIDRIDNDKGYSPDNCRWITQKEQYRTRRARRKTVNITELRVE